MASMSEEFTVSSRVMDTPVSTPSSSVTEIAKFFPAAGEPACSVATVASSAPIAVSIALDTSVELTVRSVVTFTAVTLPSTSVTFTCTLVPSLDVTSASRPSMASARSVELMELSVTETESILPSTSATVTDTFGPLPVLVESSLFISVSTLLATSVAFTVLSVTDTPVILPSTSVTVTDMLVPVPVSVASRPAILSSTY